MKAVILAGGLGTRLSEETIKKPKPMIEIGGMPILWHIMKIYSYYGVNEFIVCCGYKGYQIKVFFSNYLLHMSDITFDMQNNDMIVHDKRTDPWKVSLVYRDNTMTGGRLLRIRKYVENEKSFCFLAMGRNINTSELIKITSWPRKTSYTYVNYSTGTFRYTSIKIILWKKFPRKTQRRGIKN